jgi:hypothetical protein
MDIDEHSGLLRQAPKLSQSKTSEVGCSKAQASERREGKDLRAEMGDREAKGKEKLGGKEKGDVRRGSGLFVNEEKHGG